MSPRLTLRAPGRRASRWKWYRQAPGRPTRARSPRWQPTGDVLPRQTPGPARPEPRSEQGEAPGLATAADAHVPAPGCSSYGHVTCNAVGLQPSPWVEPRAGAQHERGSGLGPGHRARRHRPRPTTAEDLAGLALRPRTTPTGAPIGRIPCAHCCTRPALMVANARATEPRKPGPSRQGA